jgi:hypothetical protein
VPVGTTTAILDLQEEQLVAHLGLHTYFHMELMGIPSRSSVDMLLLVLCRPGEVMEHMDTVVEEKILLDLLVNPEFIMALAVVVVATMATAAELDLLVL